MNKTLLYMAPIALVGLLGTDTPAKAAVWSGSLAPNIAATTAEQTDAPIVLVRGGGGRGGGCLDSHQPDQGDRRHVKQRLYHRYGLTRCIGSSSRLLGAVSGCVETLTGAIPAIYPQTGTTGDYRA